VITCVILHFAEVRERCGTSREQLDLSPGATLEDLWSLLLQRHPGLREARLKPTPCRNRRVASWDDAVAAGDEVAFLMPVSGG
jgi:molybdopterin converting factor small subunit